MNAVAHGLLMGLVIIWMIVTALLLVAGHGSRELPERERAPIARWYPWYVPLWPCFACAFVVAMVLDLFAPLPKAEPDTVKRPPGCLCTWEWGDSACPVHPTCNGCGLPPGQCECEGPQP